MGVHLPRAGHPLTLPCTCSSCQLLCQTWRFILQLQAKALGVALALFSTPQPIPWEALRSTCLHLPQPPTPPP